MLYSKSLNFVFIHIPKTGGTAVKKFLKPHIPDLECIPPHHGELSRAFDPSLGHCPCGLADPKRTEAPGLNKETIYLSILRDPVDLWQSHFKWSIRRLKIYRLKKNFFHDTIYSLFSKRLLLKDFNDFVRKIKNDEIFNKSVQHHLVSNFKDFLTLNGTYPKNLYLIEQKRINQDLPSFLNRILGLEIVTEVTVKGRKAQPNQAPSNQTLDYIKSRYPSYYSGELEDFYFRENQTKRPIRN